MSGFNQNQCLLSECNGGREARELRVFVKEVFQ